MQWSRRREEEEGGDANMYPPTLQTGAAAEVPSVEMHERGERARGGRRKSKTEEMQKSTIEAGSRSKSMPILARGEVG